MTFNMSIEQNFFSFLLYFTISSIGYVLANIVKSLRVGKIVGTEVLTKVVQAYSKKYRS